MARDIIEQLRESFNSLVGTTNKAFETGKIQLDIQQMKLKIANLHKSVGKKVAEQHHAGDLIINLEEEDLAEKLKEIEFYTNKINELEERMKAGAQQS